MMYKSVYTKLREPHQLTLLRADGLMYCHVYADLVMLTKSDREPALSGTKNIFHEAEILLDSKTNVF